MKPPPNQTASEGAPDKANCTPVPAETQYPWVPTADDQEILSIIGDVAGRYIAAHLHQRRAAPFNANHRGAT